MKAFILILSLLTSIISTNDISLDSIEEIIKNNDLVKLKNIIDQGVDLKKGIGDFQYTPLHFAVQYNKIDIVQLLIKYNVNVNSLAKFKSTPLHSASFIDNKDIMDILIKKGASINAQDSFLNTPLHYSVSLGYKGNVILLMQNGARIDIRNIHDETPLYKCAFSKEMISILVSLGVDINMKITDKVNLLEYYISGYNDKSDFIKNIVSLGADVNILDNFGETPLHKAACSNQFEVCSILISAGADINVKSREGTTPIHYAAMNNNIEIAKLLIDHGANLTIRSKAFSHKGHNAIEMARRFKAKRMVKYLKEVLKERKE